MEEQYSLWLMPRNEVSLFLKNIIESLAIELDAPLFEPHVTVAGGIFPVEPDINEKLKKLADESEPMTLSLKETDFRDSLYRSLFIHIAPNDALLSLRERCLREFKLEHKPYMPHISLMYKRMSPDKKKEIIERTGSRFDLYFIPDTLSLVRTSGTPDNWKIIAETPFKHSS